MNWTRIPNLKSVDWITSTTELVAFGISISSDRRSLLRGASNEGVLPTYRQVCNDHVLCWVVPSVCMVERLLRLKAIRQCHRSLYTHILPTVPTATHLRLRYSDWPTPRNKHTETRQGHKKISWVRTNTRGKALLTCASKTSISGADRPTKVPSECIGPGWSSSPHVHRDSLCPGRYDRIPPRLWSPSTVAAVGCPLIVWLATVPTSQVSYVYGH